MMDSESRRRFWETLCSIADTSAESMNVLSKSIELPKCICRFRGVSDTTLFDLQNNNMKYSSADHYDDPFDTYFYIDYEKLSNKLNIFNQLNSDNNGKEMQDFIHSLSIPNEEKEEILKRYEYQRQTGSPIQLNISDLDIIRTTRTRIAKSLYSLCFCDDPLNETLWLKYADRYRGFVQIYNSDDPETFLCGKRDECRQCVFKTQTPNLYPVYYSNQRYDATRYALGLLTLDSIPPENYEQLVTIRNVIQDSLMWEAERISLIKKQCHEYDNEWRLIYPFSIPNRPYIGMKPSSIVLGFRMPEYERRLVISAAKVAEIRSILDLYIDENDELNMRPIPKTSLSI